MTKLLVIDDDPTVLLVCQRALHHADVQVLTAKTAESGFAELQRERPDVVLLDIHLPDLLGLELFQRIRAFDATIVVIFITARATADTAIEAMKLGAFDYLPKPLDLPMVRDRLRQALECQRLMRTPVTLGSDSEAQGTDVLIGRSLAMSEVYKAIGRVAPQNVPVLIQGESGTGKELVARAIYQHSPRAQKPFLAINCAAIPESLLESELFGHEKGAFTGADRQRIGKFEQCNGGTLFLDEIGDMPLALQAKMLRLLQEQRFDRVGGNQLVHTDVRILAATHQDLDTLIAQKRFRADLYFRLKVFRLHLPPLRERAGDLPLLAHYLLARFGRELGRPVEQIAPDALALLARYSWPGNVRELEGVLKQAILQTGGSVMMLADLPPLCAAEPVKSTSDFDLAQLLRQRLAAGSENLYSEMLEALERVVLSEVLTHTAGNQVQAARLLGIARNSLRKKIQQLGLAANDP